MKTNIKKKEALRIFSALSDETRLNIVELLLEGEKCVCCIFPRVKRKQATASLQLKKLVSLGILKSRRMGKFILYSIRNKRVYDILKLLK
jgi:DNA-binding transcriptional ArsR family regulator